MVLKVYHYGAVVGAVTHKGSYLDVDCDLINGLAKHDCDLESFLHYNDINYELIKPKNLAPSEAESPDSNTQEADDSDGDYEGCFFDDEIEDDCFESIAGVIENLEGFKVIFQEWEDLKCFHYGTEVGTATHKGSYIEISSTLINELSKYSLDLEAFMVSEDINYQFIKPKTVIKACKVALGLHFHIDWSDWHCPNSGTINGHYFYYKRNDVHGDYIQLIFNHQPYLSFSGFTPDHIQPYFDYIWQELEETGNIDFPKEISLGSKVAARLPDGYKAYRVSDDDSQCKVARSASKYCYIKKYRDCEFYTSFSTNPGLYPSIKSQSLEEAVAAIGKVLELTEKM